MLISVKFYPLSKEGAPCVNSFSQSHQYFYALAAWEMCVLGEQIRKFRKAEQKRRAMERGSWMKRDELGDLQKLQRLSLSLALPTSPTSCGKITTMRHGFGACGELQFCFFFVLPEEISHDIGSTCSPHPAWPDSSHKVAWWGKSHTNKKWRRAVVEETANAEVLEGGGRGEATRVAGQTGRTGWSSDDIFLAGWMGRDANFMELARRLWCAGART